MKKTTILAITMFAAILLASTFAMLPVKAPARSDVDVRFYGSHEAAYTALKAGSVDFIQWSVTYEQRLDVEADPNLAIAGFTENGMDQFDLNNNYTVPLRYPGVRNPISVKEFRQALTCMVDKNHIVNFILKGAAGVLNVPIPLNSLSWWPEDALPENYPWNYDEVLAAQRLVAAGFVDTGDADLTLNYPANWPGRPGQPNMDPLVVYVRTEDKRLDAGRYLCEQLDKFHIPYLKIEATSDVCFPAVMDDLNYHIYTGGWSLGRYPTFLYNGFHSDFWFSGGSDYVTGMNASNLPNYPDYDELAYNVYYTTDLEAAKVAAKAAAQLGWVEYCFNIPLWSYSSYVAWRKTMPGVINEFGYGYDNVYQFLNAYNTAGATIKMGTIAAPKSLNPLYATWYYDYAVMDRVYSALMGVNPYDLATDQPIAAQDWEVGSWIDPAPGPDEPSEKTMLTYYIRKGTGIVSPTGTKTGDLNAYDLAFSCWYTYIYDDGWNWADYQDVHHTEVVDDYTIKFYFDSASYWFYTAPQYPIFARDEIINKVCTTHSVTLTGPLPAGTRVKLGTADQIVEVTSENIPGNYYIFGGYEDYEHNWIALTDALPTGTYTITYYTPSLAPQGYYLAGLDWTETWYGFGPFYPIAISPGVGGYASFNKNPYYWMPTPPLSEVDWVWVWNTPGGVPGPANPGRDSGYFEIAIFDVVKATAAYGHYGTGPYDAAYMPGADLDDTDLGHIGIYDVVSITSNYGMKWGIPPP